MSKLSDIVSISGWDRNNIRVPVRTDDKRLTHPLVRDIEEFQHILESAGLNIGFNPTVVNSCEIVLFSICQEYYPDINIDGVVTHFGFEDLVGSKIIYGELHWHHAGSYWEFCFVNSEEACQALFDKNLVHAEAHPEIFSDGKSKLKSRLNKITWNYLKDLRDNWVPVDIESQTFNGRLFIGVVGLLLAAIAILVGLNHAGNISNAQGCVFGFIAVFVSCILGMVLSDSTNDDRFDRKTKCYQDLYKQILWIAFGASCAYVEDYTISLHNSEPETLDEAFESFCDSHDLNLDLLDNVIDVVKYSPKVLKSTGFDVKHLVYELAKQ